MKAIHDHRRWYFILLQYYIEKKLRVMYGQQLELVDER